MIGYRDMTFCGDRSCLNRKCYRHISQLPEKLDMPVSMSYFTECEDRVAGMVKAKDIEKREENAHRVN